MWIDTIRFRIEINEEQYKKVLAHSSQGYVRFDFVDGTEIERFQTRFGSFYAGMAVIFSMHHVDIEYSCHKWTKGVNGIPGIPCESRQNFAPLRFALAKIGLKYDETTIEVRRVDIGSLFRLDPLAEQMLWASSGRMHFPRRSATCFPTSITWGTKNSITYEKIYSKLPEQLKHKSILPIDPRINEYLESLIGVIRYECEFKPKALQGMKIKTIADMRRNMEQLKLEFSEREQNKINQLPFGKMSSKRVEEVLSRTPGLFKFWTEVMSYGHDFVKENYKMKGIPHRFYTRMKKLRDMNVPFVSLDPIAIPEYEEISLQRIA